MNNTISNANKAASGSSKTQKNIQKTWLVHMMKALPQRSISRTWGRIARWRHPIPLIWLLKQIFVKTTGIDMGDSLEPIGSYRSLEDLFVRRLRIGSRRIDPRPSVLISPVDGIVGQWGQIESKTLLQVKGRRYNLETLLSDAKEVKRFASGNYVTIYLAPYHYHRIHSPLYGHIVHSTLIPGRLMPVFPASVQCVDELFARNERLISYIDSPRSGRIAVIKVGATLVGRISVSYDTDLVTNQKKTVVQDKCYNPPIEIVKGGELGAFEMGSTVILLTENDQVCFRDLVIGQSVKMGQCLGYIQDSSE